MIRRHGPSRRVLAVAAAEDRAAVQEWLGTLPADAYGQVLMAAPADVLAGLCGPDRVMVAGPGTACASSVGEALAALVGEWIPEEPWMTPWPELWLGRTARAYLDETSPMADRLALFEVLPAAVATAQPG